MYVMQVLQTKMFTVHGNTVFKIYFKQKCLRYVKFNYNQSTHRFFIGQKHIYEKGHSHCASSGNNDISIICLWGDFNTLCGFHPADPLDLQHKQNDMESKKASGGLGSK